MAWVQNLPFLIVHGALIWKVCVGAMALAPFPVIRLFRRLRANRGARRHILEQMIHVTPALRAGPAVLYGRLGGGHAWTVARGRTQIDESSGELWIDFRGERIVLPDSIRVERGTRVAHKRSWWCASRVTTIGPGDEILVTGYLEERLTGIAFRDTAQHWLLRPLASKQVSAAAVTPVTTPSRMSVVTLALLTVAFGASSVLVLHHLGETKLTSAKEPDRGGTAIFDLELAASMPGSRTEAIELFAKKLAEQPNTNDMFEQRLALTKLTDTCAADLFRELGKLDESLAAARRCGSMYDIASRLADSAEFTQAARYVVPYDRSGLATTIHIAVGDWMAAAQNVTARANDHDPDVPPETEASRHERDRCISALFVAWGGATNAFEHLDTSHGWCALTSALAHDNGTSRAALELVVRDAYNYPARYDVEVRDLATLLWYASGGSVESLGFELASPEYLGSWQWEWLAQSIIETHPEANLSSNHRDRGYQLMKRGDFVGARAELAYLDEDDAALLTFGLDLRSNTDVIVPPEHRRALGLWAELRNGDEVIESDLYDFSGCAEYRSALVSPSSASLIDAIDSCGISHDESLAILSVLPRIKKNRGALITSLRLHSSRTSFDFLPEMFEAVADARDLARLAGDDSEIVRLQAINDRLAAVLSDRRRLIGLMLN
jgi:hypothetical protein